MKSYPIAKSRRVRSTPYTSRIEKQGVTAYTVYNHMLLPAAFGSLEESCDHLKKNVQIWDVAAEISIADSDVIFFAKGLASGNKFDVKIFEPIVDILAVQGPKSFDLMEKVFGEKMKELKFFGFDYFTFNGAKHLIARSGWSKQGGFEIYVENTNSGLKLYDHLFEIGKEFNVRPGCPNLIERIESGLLSYGNDFDNNDNPFQCGFDKYVDLETDINFLGKDKLKKIKEKGIDRKLMGVQIDLTKILLTSSLNIKNNDGNIIGELRSACYSPHFKKVIGIAMIKEPYCKASSSGTIEIDGNSLALKVCDLPFI